MTEMTAAVAQPTPTPVPPPVRLPAPSPSTEPSAGTLGTRIHLERVCDVLFRAGNHRAAAAEYQRFIDNSENLRDLPEADSNRLLARAHFFLACSQIELGQYQAAHLRLAAFVGNPTFAVSPQVLEARFRLAQCSFQQRQWAQAQTELQSFLEQSPFAGDTARPEYVQMALVLLGDTLFNQGQHASAVERYSESLRRFPNGRPAVDSYLGRARTYAAQGRTSSAIADYRLAETELNRMITAIPPETPATERARVTNAYRLQIARCSLFRGNLLRNQQPDGETSRQRSERYTTALAAYRTVVESEPRSPYRAEALRHTAVLQIHLAQIVDSVVQRRAHLASATATLAVLRRDHATEPYALNAQAVVAAHQALLSSPGAQRDGHWQTAITALQSLQTRHPTARTTQDTLRALAGLAYDNGDFERSADLFGQIVRAGTAGPNHADGQFFLAWSEYRRGRHAEAQTLFSQFIRDHGSDSRVTTARGMATLSNIEQLYHQGEQLTRSTQATDQQTARTRYRDAFNLATNSAASIEDLGHRRIAQACGLRAGEALLQRLIEAGEGDAAQSFVVELKNAYPGGNLDSYLYSLAHQYRARAETLGAQGPMQQAAAAAARERESSAFQLLSRNFGQTNNGRVAEIHLGRSAANWAGVQTAAEGLIDALRDAGNDNNTLQLRLFARVALGQAQLGRYAFDNAQSSLTAATTELALLPVGSRPAWQTIIASHTTRLSQQRAAYGNAEQLLGAGQRLSAAENPTRDILLQAQANFQAVILSCPGSAIATQAAANLETTRDALRRLGTPEN